MGRFHPMNEDSYARSRPTWTPSRKSPSAMGIWNGQPDAYGLSSRTLPASSLRSAPYGEPSETLSKLRLGETIRAHVLSFAVAAALVAALVIARHPYLW